MHLYSVLIVAGKGDIEEWDIERVEVLPTGEGKVAVLTEGWCGDVCLRVRENRGSISIVRPAFWREMYGVSNKRK